MSDAELQELRRQLDGLLEQGHIRPSVYPYAVDIIKSEWRKLTWRRQHFGPGMDITNLP
jgi:hypothetical protein